MGDLLGAGNFYIDDYFAIIKILFTCTFDNICVLEHYRNVTSLNSLTNTKRGCWIGGTINLSSVGMQCNPSEKENIVRC